MKRKLAASWRRLAGFRHPSVSLAGMPEGEPSAAFPTDLAPTISRVAFIRTDGIGDALLAAGFLQALGSAYPHWKIQVVCPASAAAVFRHHPQVDAVLPFDLKAYLTHRSAFEALHGQVEALGAELALNAVRSRYPYTDRLAMAAHARVRVGLSDGTAHMSQQARAQADRRYTHLFQPAREGASEADTYQRLLAWMGVDLPFPGPVMACQPEEEAWAEAFLQREGLDPSRLVILMAGALHEVRYARQYGPALRLAALEDATVVAVGAAGDRRISEENLSSSGHRTLNLCGATSLGQCAALMARARLAVGAETGLAHLACSVGLPQALILGGGHFGRFMPYSPLTTFVTRPLECFSCGWACRYASVHCIQDVPAAALARAIEHAWIHGRTQPEPAGFLAAPGPVGRGPRGADPRGWIDRPCAWIESP